MLQRFAIHLALVFLFALTQIGVATHEISHILDAEKHGQQEQESQYKHTTAEQCEQCISYAKIASGLQLPAFAIAAIKTSPIVIICQSVSFSSRYFTAYSARAPPQITSI